MTPVLTDDSVLLHRISSGVEIAAGYFPECDSGGITLVNHNNGDLFSVLVPKADIKAAFDHPAVFLPASVVGRFFA